MPNTRTVIVTPSRGRISCENLALLERDDLSDPVIRHGLTALAQDTTVPNSVREQANELLQIA